VFCSGKRNWLKRDVREEAEKVLGAAVLWKKVKSHEPPPEWFTGDRLFPLEAMIGEF
jgi:hypothetical protein